MTARIVSIPGTTASTSILAVANGGTGASTAPTARINLGSNDANGRMPTAQLPTQILSSYWHASYDEMNVISGLWHQQFDGGQTDYDSSLVPFTGYLASNGVNGAEVNFGTLTLNAGTYKVVLSIHVFSNFGILEVLHGTTSIGTYDTHGLEIYNDVIFFTYSPTTRVSNLLRLKNSGTGSSGYAIEVGRLEIIRTG